MTRTIVAAFNEIVSGAWERYKNPDRMPLERQPLDKLAEMPTETLPRMVRESKVAMEMLALLGRLKWSEFPEEPEEKRKPGPVPQKRAPYVAAFIIKIERKLRYMGDLRKFLCENPEVVWLLGFELKASKKYRWGFDVEESLSCRRQFGRVLRKLHAKQTEFILNGTVEGIKDVLPEEAIPEGERFGDRVTVDTKHIIAWVRENNEKAFMENAHKKEVQPKGDKDCKLGCKKSTNQKSKGKSKTEEVSQPEASASQSEKAKVEKGKLKAASDGTPKTTPTKEGIPGSQAPKGTYYWGYGTGVVVTKVKEWGEFVLGEYTQTFDNTDNTYFHPLMEQTETRLGYKPRWGALDAAFDASYVYDYFHNPEVGGFAAVPFVNRGGHGMREFDDENRPLCAAKLGMPLKSTFICKTSMVEHEKGRFGCPLLHPDVTGEACPINHEKFATGGCKTTMATSDGARIRYTLDREDPAFKLLYNERTATERINSQAVEYNIERPKLRNQQSITHTNTLIYALINLKAVQRIEARKLKLAQEACAPAQ